MAVGALAVHAQQAPPAATPPAAPTAQPTQGDGRSTNLGTDANGNPLRLALKTGHVSNYDESKVKPYTLPDPLVLKDGKQVSDARTWETRRRPEILAIYQSQIYGRLPANLPKVTWAEGESDPQFREGKALRRQIVGTVGEGPKAAQIKLSVYTPTAAKGRVPVILLANFGGGNTPPPAGRGGPPSLGEPPVADEVLARGWGYATLQYQDIQPDRANAFTEGVIGLTLPPGASAPAADEWGTISAWAWGISRAIDYLASDSHVDPMRIALQGHSRLGKTVLWASALDDRVAASSRAAPVRWAPRSRDVIGARRSTTWRRTSRGSSPATSSSGPAAGTKCRSTRTC